MLLTVVCVIGGAILLVVLLPVLMRLFMLGGMAVDWIEENITLNSQLVWGLAGCSVLGAVVLLAYLLR